MSCEDCVNKCKTLNLTMEECTKACPKCVNVCTNQDVFNRSFREAVRDYNKDKEAGTWVMWVAMAVVIGVMLLALFLSTKMADGSNNDMLQYLLAIVFSPIYIIAYVLGRN